MKRITYGLSALVLGLLLATALAPQTVKAQLTNLVRVENFTTLIGHVDGLEGLIGTTNTLLTSGTAASTPTQYAALSTTVQTIKGSAGTLDSFTCYNPNATAAWIQVFNISGTVTLGTSTALERYHVPGEQSFGAIAMSKGYDTAIKVAATTTATGSTAPTTGLVCNFGHR
jgi:hypothetical protein